MKNKCMQKKVKQNKNVCLQSWSKSHSLHLKILKSLDNSVCNMHYISSASEMRNTKWLEGLEVESGKYSHWLHLESTLIWLSYLIPFFLYSIYRVKYSSTMYCIKQQDNTFHRIRRLCFKNVFNFAVFIRQTIKSIPASQQIPRVILHNQSKTCSFLFS